MRKGLASIPPGRLPLARTNAQPTQQAPVIDPDPDPDLEPAAPAAVEPQPPVARSVPPRLLLLALLLGAAAPLSAQAESAPGWWSLNAENNNLVVDEDRHYVNGFNIAYLTPRLAPQDGALRRGALALQDGLPWLFPVSAAAPDRRLEWTVLGQQLFTPANKDLSTPDPRDRPYAGWLYTGAALMQNSGSAYQELSGTFGVVGPWALGQQVQNSFHKAFGFGRTEGWSHQLHNEPALTLAYVRKWRLGTRVDAAGGLELDALPELGATLGNVLSYGEAGALLRLGWGLAADYGPRMLQPGLTGGGYFNPDGAARRWGGYVFAGAQQRAVGHNLFLDGNSWRSSPAVERYPWVHDEYFGISVYGWRQVRADFTYVRRSREFSAQPGDDRYGSATIAVRW